jgi:RimJ/RimL family protein N-acetyltransferase
MIRHALASMDTVVFRVAATNLRSRKALEKIGAVLTDRSEVADVAGTPVLHVLYAVRRDAPIAATPLPLAGGAGGGGN